MSIKRDILWRIYLAFIAVCCMGFTIVYKVVQVKRVEGSALLAKFDNDNIKFLPVDAERGNILSEDGRLLATSLPFYEVRIDLAADALDSITFFSKVDSLANMLAAFNKDKTAFNYKQDLINGYNKEQRNFLVKRNANYAELQEIKSWPILNRGRDRGGLIIAQFAHRVIPFQSLAKRTIGYVRGDSIKPVGIEGSFNTELSGIKGKRLMQQIAGGTWIPVNDEDEFRSENGKDVVTTIDVNLQDMVESALRRALVHHNAKQGCAVLMEVSTGKIKAIANLGRVSDGVYDEIQNFAIGDADEPGSTFKLASLITLLEDGKVHITDSVNIEGGKVEFYNKTLHDAEDHHLTNVTVKHAFEVSSNVAIAKLVEKHYGHQPEKFTQHLIALGLNDTTGVEVKGEGHPKILQPNQKGWSGTTLPWMAVGYGVQESPLQILTLYNAIANNGYRVKPYLVKEIQLQGKVVKSFTPNISSHKICSDATLAKMQELLQGVVDTGTASGIRSKDFKIAGKTGTAQVLVGNSYSNSLYRSSFVGYFPADKPVYSCMVLVVEPSNGEYYGGKVAAPVFKEIAEKIYATSLQLLAKFNIQLNYQSNPMPDMKSGMLTDAQTVCKKLGITTVPDSEAVWVAANAQAGNIQLKARYEDDNQVPNVVGMGLKDALYLLENRGMVVQATGKGKVKQQSITAGSAIVRGQAINIELN